MSVEIGSQPKTVPDTAQPVKLDPLDMSTLPEAGPGREWRQRRQFKNVVYSVPKGLVGGDNPMWPDEEVLVVYRHENYGWWVIPWGSKHPKTSFHGDDLEEIIAQYMGRLRMGLL